MMPHLTQPPDRDIRAVVRKLYAFDLPDSAAVATFLSSLGITGQLCSFSYCPIAVYLTRQTGRAMFTCGSVTYRWGWTGPSVELPQPWQNFIREFDEGAYPSLAA